ncbi:unnamed protein product [Cochlearia groenlandica]
MSQYFRSPPPVYARNWAKSQNLVESTKIERQIVLSKKTHQKEKKKKVIKIQKSAKFIKPLIFPITKLVSEESEQLERSCLTEEHNHLGYLSDGSQDSNKRRKKASPSVECNVKATMPVVKPLRIRFVFKKPKEVEVVPREDPHVCSTSGNNHFVAKTSPVSVLDESLLSTSLKTDGALTLSESKKRKSHRTSKESRYNKLFDEWVPLCNSMEEDDCNFSGRGQKSAPPTIASITKDEDMTKNVHVSGDSYFPKANFLSEVGIFPLPYTVPF